MRESHAVRLASVALDLGDEPVLILGAGLEAALAVKHAVHDCGEARKVPLKVGKIRANER